MMPPMLNLGSSSEPLIGRLTSMTPLRSLSSATASSTGSLVAVRALDLVAEGELVER